MIVGIDIGGTKALCMAIDPADGAILATAKASSRGSGPELVETLTGLVREVEAASGQVAESIGIGIAGLVTRDGVVRYSPNLPDIVEFPVADAMRDATGLPVACGNDATAGTWAEHRLGAGKGSDDMLFVALGTGIGMGLVAHGTSPSTSNSMRADRPVRRELRSRSTICQHSSPRKRRIISRSE